MRVSFRISVGFLVAATLIVVLYRQAHLVRWSDESLAIVLPLNGLRTTAKPDSAGSEMAAVDLESIRKREQPTHAGLDDIVVSREEFEAMKKRLEEMTARDAQPSSVAVPNAQPSSRDAPVFGELMLRKQLDGQEVEEFYDNGQRWYEAKQELQDGKWVRHGAWNAYWDNGQIHEDGAYANGVEQGVWKWLHSDSTPMAHGRFLEGRREGPWVFFHESGHVMMEGSYMKGEGSGLWTSYHENGSRRAEGRYDAGGAVGHWNVWNEDGSLNEEMSGQR
ncbi:MAG: antitoxin component YwqK of YwqJK toxin-antitoxin module [Planctomycetota bacterium]|jgi:antitoxin component YwqK of YwqJK toxin-antitoxin module